MLKSYLKKKTVFLHHICKARLSGGFPRRYDPEISDISQPIPTFVVRFVQIGLREWRPLLAGGGGRAEADTRRGIRQYQQH